MEYTQNTIEKIANVSFTLLYNTLAKDKDPIEVFPAVTGVINEICSYAGSSAEVHPNLIRYGDALREIRPGGVIRESLLEMFDNDATPSGLIRVMSCGLIYYAKIGLDFEETIREYTEYDNSYLIKSIRNDLIDLRDSR
jgi:hypothetical protein